MSLEKQENIIISAKDSEIKDDSSARDIALQKFVAAVSGLENIIDHETTLLENHQNPDYNDINARKTRGLRDLNNSMSEIVKYMNKPIEQKISVLLASLQKKLERNSALLQIHLEAVEEILHIMHDSARAKETDGTYFPYSADSGAYK